LVRLRLVLLVLFAPLALLAGCTDEPVPDTELVRADQTLPVMGTVLHLSAWADSEDAGRAANEAGRAAVLRVDSLMSHYRPESEISRMGAAAGTRRWTRLSPETFEVVAAALDWAERSGGAFDPTVGPLMRAWGFFDHEPGRPPPDEARAAAALVDYRRVRLDSTGTRAQLEHTGMLLDLGALAKGYALDQALRAMTGGGARAAMVDLGGNVAVAGRRGVDERERWTMGIRHPRHPDSLMGTLGLASGSVATSGDYEQMFEEDGVRYSHLMDPRTGTPARGVVAVTVAAADGMAADALSTLLFVLGPDAGQAFLRREGLIDDLTVVWILDQTQDAPADAPGGAAEGERWRVVTLEGTSATLELDPVR
jgi:thiamine biosynthesis lipoprotein